MAQTISFLKATFEVGRSASMQGQNESMGRHALHVDTSRISRQMPPALLNRSFGELVVYLGRGYHRERAWSGSAGLAAHASSSKARTFVSLGTFTTERETHLPLTQPPPYRCLSMLKCVGWVKAR